MIKFKNNSIGILGGSFDPPHLGHLKISKITLKKLNLKKIYWVITKKNPQKKRPFFSINIRLLKCFKITKKFKKIHVKFIDDKIKSSRTIKVIEFFKKKNKNTKIYLILGSDNLIHFHKWNNWKKILRICELVVFSRKGFDKKARKAKIIGYLKDKNIIFIKNKKIDISSTMLRKNYQNKYI